MAAQLAFETEEGVDRGEGEPAFVVDIDGFEGPLDLLLELARRQKVDLARISVLALAEQYLAFIEQARKVRLELAADYLVMAAWLAYLKSRLLLPEPPQGGGAGRGRTRRRAGAPAAAAGADPARRRAARSIGRGSGATFSRAASPRRSRSPGDRNIRRPLRSAVRLCAPAPETGAGARPVAAPASSGRSPRRARR